MDDSLHSPRGFTLIESLVASVIVSAVLASLAQLITSNVVRTADSRRAVRAIAMAQAKLETLRALRWSFELDGSLGSAPALQPSPPGTLAQDTAGYVEYLDSIGSLVTAADHPEFVRRWAIAPYASGDVHTLDIRVCVFSNGGSGQSGALAAACVSGLRTRRS